VSVIEYVQVNPGVVNVLLCATIGPCEEYNRPKNCADNDPDVLPSIPHVAVKVTVELLAGTVIVAGKLNTAVPVLVIYSVCSWANC
jgi:hypothetical protein